MNRAGTGYTRQHLWFGQSNEPGRYMSPPTGSDRCSHDESRLDHNHILRLGLAIKAAAAMIKIIWHDGLYTNLLIATLLINSNVSLKVRSSVSSSLVCAVEAILAQVNKQAWLASSLMTDRSLPHINVQLAAGALT